MSKFDDTPLTLKETVRVPDSRIGKTVGYDNGKWKVLFEDGTEMAFSEIDLKRVKILKG